MIKNKICFFLLSVFSLVSIALFADAEMKCDLCEKDLKVEITPINSYFTSYNNFSLERNANKIFPLVFTFPTLIKCPYCNYISVPCALSSHADKDKTYAYIKSHPEIKNTDFTAKPWLQYEYAAKMSELNSDESLLIGRCYLLAAWVSNNEKPLDEFQMQSLERILPTKIISTVLEQPAIEDYNQGPSTLEWLNSIIKLENKLKSQNFTDAEKAVIYLILGNTYFASNNITKAEDYYNKFLNTSAISSILNTPDMVLQLSQMDNLKTLKDDLLNKVKRSRKYDELAKKYFLKSLNETHVLPKGKTLCYYLLGELERSLGNFKEAEKYYNETLNSKDLDKIIIDNINFIFKNFLNTDLSKINPNIALEEEKAIKEIFKNINNDPLKLYAASKDLKNNSRRDLIFPKLKEYIESGNDELINAAIYSLSDRTQEAIDLQVDLIKKGKASNEILNNLRFNSDLIKKSDDFVFIKIFNKIPNPRWNITSYLVALDTDNCRKAIIARAKDMLSDNKIIPLCEKDEENTALAGAYSAVLTALSEIQNKESVEIIVDLLNRLNKIDSSSRFHRNLYIETVNSLETVFNKSFGFVRTTSDRPLGKFPKGIKEKDPAVAYKEFNDWYNDFLKSGKTVAQAASEGFSPMGYNVEPIDSLEALEELITGLTDSYNPVRINCYKELVKRTGIMHRACNNYDFIGFNTDYTKNFYSEWLKENKSKLVFDKQKQRFIIK